MTDPTAEAAAEAQYGARIDAILADVRRELIHAIACNGPMHSPHEMAAVIREEHDELWDEVRAYKGRAPVRTNLLNMRWEAVQMCAMGVRGIIDVIDPLTERTPPPTD